jgi:hypothetical protein
MDKAKDKGKAAASGEKKEKEDVKPKNFAGAAAPQSSAPAKEMTEQEKQVSSILFFDCVF